jgi:hypothetical protein
MARNKCPIPFVRDATVTAAELNILDGVTSTAAELNILDGVTATAAEINNAADISAKSVTYTATSPAAIPAGTNCICLNHATVAIEKTISTLVNHPGIMVIKNTSASGTAAHTVTVTTGTFNGTHKVATLDAPGECLTVFIDHSGSGSIILNTGTVGLS